MASNNQVDLSEFPFANVNFDELTNANLDHDFSNSGSSQLTHDDPLSGSSGEGKASANETPQDTTQGIAGADWTYQNEGSAAPSSAQVPTAHDLDGFGGFFDGEDLQNAADQHGNQDISRSRLLCFIRIC